MPQANGFAISRLPELAADRCNVLFPFADLNPGAIRQFIPWIENHGITFGEAYHHPETEEAGRMGNFR